MDVTIASFQEQFPEFGDTPDATITRAIEKALVIHSRVVLATLYLTAHFVKIAQLTADNKVPSTEVKSRGVGPLQASYLTQAEDGSEAFFTTTSYGRQFLALEKRTKRAQIGATVVG